MKKAIALAAAALLASAAHADCYTVLDSKGLVLVESTTPPVDMQYQLHQTVPHRFGQGARLVFGPADEDCGNYVDHTDGDSLKATARQAVVAEQIRQARAAERQAAADAAMAAAVAATTDEPPAAAPAPAAAEAPAPASAAQEAAVPASAPAADASAAPAAAQ